MAFKQITIIWDAHLLSKCEKKNLFEGREGSLENERFRIVNGADWKELIYTALAGCNGRNVNNQLFGINLILYFYYIR